MNKKELLISAKFDTADFDKSVESMQKKLKEIYAPSDMVRNQTQMANRMASAGMNTSGITNPGQAGSQAAVAQSRRDLEQSIQRETMGQEKLFKFITVRAEKVKELKALQDSMTKGSEAELALREKIAKVEENINKQRSMFNGRAQGINTMMDHRNQGSAANAGSAMEAYQQGKWSGVKEYAGANKMGVFGGVMGGIGAVGGIVGGIGAAGEHFAGYQQRLEAARGSAIQNSTGRDLQDVYGGRSAFESVFSGERAQAAGLAQQKTSSNKWTDRFKGLGSIGGLIGGAGLVAGGLATGAASIAGMPFTAGGSALGLTAAGTMIGAGAGMFGGGVAGLSNDRTRKSMNPFAQDEYRQMLAAEEAQSFRSNYDNLKNQDPSKKLSLENYEKNRMGDVSMQRSLGLSDKGFYGDGGFKNQATAAGFDPSQAMGMASSILGAGGSARMGKNSAFGLQMERAGLTNAGSVLGQMSGGVSDPESSKRATIMIMSEAFKIGLDNTDFAEENRRFTQAAATVIGRSGANSGDDADRITRTLSQFMGEKTNNGVAASQNSYEQYQQRSGQLDGRRGAMRFSAAQQDKNFSKLGTNDLTEIMGARDEDFREDSAGMQLAAKQANFGSVGEMKDARNKINAKSRLLIPGNQEKMNKSTSVIQAYMNKTGKSWADVTKDSESGNLPMDVQDAVGKGSLTLSSENKDGFNQTKLMSQLGEFVTDKNSSKKAKGLIDATSALGGSDRLSDKITGSAAEGAEAARVEFNKLADTLAVAAKNAKGFTDTVQGIANQANAQASQNRKNGPVGDPNTISSPMIQDQAGKPRR